MLCSAEELLQKNLALSNTWQRYQATPSFESFVELAVSINSFTEFLIDKSITALHHASHQLEQVALTLFNKDVAHPLPQATLDDLSERMHALERLRTRFLEDEKVVGEIATAHPGADLQYLRQLRRNALKEKAEGKPPRAYRELFRVLRELEDQADD